MVKLNSISFANIIALVSVALVVAFLIIQLPKQRNQKIDFTTSNDLATLSYSIEQYFYDNNEQPRSIRRLDVSDDLKTRAKNNNYEYEKISFSSYKLCADFKTDTSDVNLDINYYPQMGVSTFLGGFDESIYPAYAGNPDVNNHKAEHTCFQFDLYGYYDDYGYEDSLESYDSFGTEGPNYFEESAPSESIDDSSFFEG